MEFIRRFGVSGVEYADNEVLANQLHPTECPSFAHFHGKDPIVRTCGLLGACDRQRHDLLEGSRHRIGADGDFRLTFPPHVIETGDFHFSRP